MDNYNYHKGMNVIIQELKDLLKTKSIGTDSDQALLLDFQETLGTIYLMTANLPQAKTHFKRAFKIYEKTWADEPEMIEAKYQEIQELYPQVGFFLGQQISRFFNKTGIIWGRKYLFQFFIYILYDDNVLTLGTYLNILYLNGGVLYGNN